MSTLPAVSAAVNTGSTTELTSLAPFDDAPTGDYAAIPAMLNSAGSKLKNPRLWLGELTLKLAIGAHTKWPTNGRHGYHE
jgi:hypothetical protein